MKAGRLALIGLDCADPRLIEDLLPGMPTLAELARGGNFAPLASVDPPITVPAWMCMFTGRDPGELGVYGFRNRTDHTYSGWAVASSAAFPAPAVWDVLGRRGIRSVLLGIPGTYPPRPVRGAMVSGPLTPGPEANFAYPPWLKAEITDWVGEYLVDVRNFRTENKDQLLEQVHAMTGQRFTLARRLSARVQWDLFAMVDMGPDRVHHGLWAHHDPRHRRFDPHSPYRSALREYYQFLDRQLGEFLSDLPGGTQVVVVSDHGVQRMEGGIGINEWLVREGYLVLRDYPPRPMRMDELIRTGAVDWSRTVAWGEGGHYGRVFLNVAGREPAGCVPQRRYEQVRAELAARLAAIPGSDGTPLRSRALRPQQLYRQARGIPPDLIVYFDDLAYRSLGTVGWNRVHLPENDTGPDDANHAPQGMFLANPPLEAAPRSLLGVAGLICEHFGLKEGL
ncbi:MAG: alkaline phosphatase family protein [Candidatus Bipolaricaulaceae bacterium]